MYGRLVLLALAAGVLVGCTNPDAAYREDAAFKVSGESLLALPPLPEKHVEEWVWEGLVSRKDLAAGDQTLELRKAQVIEALAGFLPNVVLGGGGLSGSIEDVALRGWAGSLIGTWALFEGYRTVQQYRAAKATRETEFKLQEERMTAVVIAVTATAFYMSANRKCGEKYKRKWKWSMK